jgi:hypothetical protein
VQAIVTRISILMLDLDLGDRPALAGNWLVEAGRRVVQGDRLLELAAELQTRERILYDREPGIDDCRRAGPFLDPATGRLLRNKRS